jgi:endonuclease YncB( thermonuclease family)
MRKRNICPLVLFFPLLMSWPLSAGQFKVIWIFDGDTFKAEGHDIQIVVRLVAIDAPEMTYKRGQADQPFSRQSKSYLTERILHKTVELKGYSLDKNNRVLAIVSYGGRNIGLEMVRKGLAEVYRGEMPEDLELKDYQQAEFEARTARRGIWSQGDRYVSPREWRERRWRRERRY